MGQLRRKAELPQLGLPYGGYPKWRDAKILEKLEEANPGRSHPDDPLTDLRHHTGPSRAAPLVAVVLAGDQRPMPGEQGVWCHD